MTRARHRVVRRALGCALLVLIVVQGARLSAEAVAVRAVPIELCPAHPEQVGIGRLRYRGGLWLASDDPRFGGFSSLRILNPGSGAGSADAPRLVAVSDEGRWLSGRLVEDASGSLTGLTETEMGALHDPEGRPLASKEAADAESLAVLPDGSFVVGFEHQHRLWRYSGATGRPEGPATPLPGPAELGQAPPNGGLEAVVALTAGRLLALTEFWVQGNRIRGWFDGPSDWKPIGYRFAGAFRPSDAALLPSGDILILERAYNPQRGVVAINFRRVEQSRLKKGATLPSQLVGSLAPPLVLDNFEGLDCRREPGGATVLYVISDDNFSKEQRTLLLKFELSE